MRKFLVSFITVSAVCGFFFIIFFILPQALSSNYEVATPINVPLIPPAPPPVTHVDTPESVKALYMTACTASGVQGRTALKTLIETTELNSVVIDIKDFTGVVSIPEANIHGLSTKSGCVITDMKDFIQELHDSDIYVIGRISVFQDPLYSAYAPELAVRKKSDGGVWKDYKGLSFIDVGARSYWDYIIEISKIAYEIGFDELNYDYVRYPSDGNMQDTNFTHTVGTTTKPEMLKSFFAYLDENLQAYELKNPASPAGGLKTSVDLFGMTTTVNVDMGIGQIIENAMPYFDYIAPMVYPSHYPKSWNGFANPAERPYEVIKIAMKGAVDKEERWRIANGIATSTPSKMRPWLQDFSLGATYGADKVQAQIKATYDVGLNSWMLWNASNKYTRGALILE